MSEKAVARRVERQHDPILERRKNFFEKLKSPAAKWLAFALLAVEAQACTKQQLNTVVGAMTLGGAPAGGKVEIGFQSQGQGIGPGVRLEAKPWPGNLDPNSLMRKYRETAGTGEGLISGFFDPGVYLAIRAKEKTAPTGFLNPTEFGFMPGNEPFALSQTAIPFHRGEMGSDPEFEDARAAGMLATAMADARFLPNLGGMRSHGLRLRWGIGQPAHASKQDLACLMMPLVESGPAGPTGSLEDALVTRKTKADKTKIIFSERSNADGHPEQAAVVAWYNLQHQVGRSYLPKLTKLENLRSEFSTLERLVEDYNEHRGEDGYADVERRYAQLDPKRLVELAKEITKLEKELERPQLEIKIALLKALLPHIVFYTPHEKDVRVHFRIYKEDGKIEAVAVVDDPRIPAVKLPTPTI